MDPVRQDEKEFPILYGCDKKNNCRIWKVTINNTKPDYTEIIVLHGLLNGKQIETITKINIGKNIGKKNETSHYQQALLEAKSKWNKKKDIEHYTTTQPDSYTKQIPTSFGPVQDRIPTLFGPVQDRIPTLFGPVQDRICTDSSREDNLVVNNQKILTVPTPMLAHDYKKYKHKLKFPCYIQKKYDGYRLLYDPITNNMYTRNGKKYDILYNTELHKQLKNIGLPLDGELYCHTDFSFECYGILRKKKLSDATQDHQLLDRIEYHVYDLHNSPCLVQSALESLTYEQRYALLCDKIKYENSKIKLVDTYICTSDENIDNYHTKFIHDNYEGSILRNKDSLYESKRSFNLLKYKDFDDEEFVISDFTTEKCNDIDLIIWICKTKENKTFNIRPQGTKEERQYLFTIANRFMNQKLWVKYFGYTENKIPRFPTTKTNTYKTYIRNEVY